MSNDAQFLKRALELAHIRRGFCAPNPSVGAVVVKNDQVIGEGFHWAAGQSHAEVNALNQAGDEAKGATVYVTLEPCRHTGRTPPCTEALKKAGVARVIYGFADPNPLMAGQSESLLREAGLVCEGLFLPEISDFYRSYAYWWRTKKPWVTAKLAMSLDAKIAGPNGKPVQLTGAKLKERTFHERKRADALLTTVKTIQADDPQLNVRFSGEVIAKPLYILDTCLELPLTAHIFKTGAPLTVFYAWGAPKERQKALEEQGVTCYPVQLNEQNHLSWPEILTQIGQDGCHDLFVEAGGTCFSGLLSAGVVGRAMIYVAPRFLGEGALNAFPNLQRDLIAPRVTWQTIENEAVCELEWNL